MLAVLLVQVIFIVSLPSLAVVLPQSDDESEDESVSSASSSDPEPSLVTNHQQQWETFDDLDTQQPPILPPRTELLSPSHTAHQERTPSNPLTESTGSNNPFRDFDYEANEESQSELTFNVIESNLDKGGARTTSNNNNISPFESLDLSARAQSPFDDFSSSVAEALINNSGNTDSLSNFLSHASQDLEKIPKENSNDLILANSVALDESSPATLLTPPLIPTTTSASPTQDLVTEMLGHTQRKSSAPPAMSATTANAYSGFHASASAPVFPLQQNQAMYTQYPNPFYNFGYQQMTYSSKNIRRPAGPRSPKFAQDIPLSIPQVPLNCTKKRPPPPPRPQPYSRPQENKDDPLMQRLPSIGEFNPFESLLGEGGMEAYVKKETSTDSPLV